MFLAIIIGCGLIGFLEMVPLIRKRQYKELLLYSGLFLTASLLILLLSLHVKLPSPAKTMDELIKRFGHPG